MSEPPWLTRGAIAVAGRILDSHRALFLRPLLAGTGPHRTPRQRAQELFAADTVVLAHDGDADPRLIYANRAALRLWRRRWEELVGLPSRLTAEPAERRRRAAVLEHARRRDAIEGVGGIRIDAAGGRFRIEAARLWSLRDGAGGQGAAFCRWWRLPAALPGRSRPSGVGKPG
jgi:hypothetical protein